MPPFLISWLRAGSQNYVFKKVEKVSRAKPIILSFGRKSIPLPLLPYECKDKTHDTSEASLGTSVAYVCNSYVPHRKINQSVSDKRISLGNSIFGRQINSLPSFHTKARFGSLQPRVATALNCCPLLSLWPLSMWWERVPGRNFNLGPGLTTESRKLLFIFWYKEENVTVTENGTKCWEISAARPSSEKPLKYGNLFFISVFFMW